MLQILSYFSVFYFHKSKILTSWQFSTETWKPLKLNHSRKKTLATIASQILGTNFLTTNKNQHIRNILSKVESCNLLKLVNLQAKSFKYICEGNIFSATAVEWTATIFQPSRYSSRFLTKYLKTARLQNGSKSMLPIKEIWKALKIWIWRPLKIIWRQFGDQIYTSLLFN